MDTNTMNTDKHGLYYALIKSLHTVLMNIKQHMLLFIICIILGITPFMYKYYGSTGGYKASFTVVYDELTRKIYGDRLVKINVLVGRKQYGIVSQYLNTDINTVRSLTKVEGKNILGEDLSKDLNTDHIPFMVNFITKDSSTVPALQAGILHFLEYGNNFVADRQKIKVEQIDKEIQYIDGILDRVDSIEKSKGTGISGIMMGAKDGNSSGTLFEFSYNLYKKKQELQQKRALPNNLYVIDDAIVTQNTAGSLTIYTIAGIVAGLILYFVIGGLLIPAIRFKP